VGGAALVAHGGGGGARGASLGQALGFTHASLILHSSLGLCGRLGVAERDGEGPPRCLDDGEGLLIGALINPLRVDLVR